MTPKQNQDIKHWPTPRQVSRKETIKNTLTGIALFAILIIGSSDWMSL